MASAERRLQILCLHGYRQNDVVFREKTGGLRKIIKRFADLHYISAPHRPNVTSSDDRGDIRGWWFSKPDSQFSSRDSTNIATGFDESVEYIVQYWRDHGPFDGLFGFSQGASMIHLLLAKWKLEQINIEPPNFVIFASGFLSLSTLHDELTNVNLSSIPSLHIFGIGDEVVLYPISEKLVSRFEPKDDGERSYAPLEIRHEGGHFIPPMSRYKQPFIEFLEGQLVRARGKDI